MTSGELGNGLSCDSQYFVIHNSQYIEILCIYTLKCISLFLTLPDLGVLSDYDTLSSPLAKAGRGNMVGCVPPSGASITGYTTFFRGCISPLCPRIQY